jgi:hypothetical protein
MNDDHLKFSDDIKKHWIVKKDECRDEFIALNGKNALGKGGLDHIYLIEEEKAGLWLTSQGLRKITTLQNKVPSLAIEQMGNGEAVLSVPIEDLHNLCKAVGARKRQQLNEQRLEQLKNCANHARAQKTLIKSVVTAPKIDECRIIGS